MSSSSAAPAPSVARALVTGASISLIGAAATAIFGLARVKGLAVVLGPGGLGIYGQLWAFVLYAGTVSALGIGIGATKIAARERERDDVHALQAVSWFVVALPLAVGAVFVVVAAGGVGRIAPLLLGTDRVSLVVVAAVSIPFVGMQTTLQGLLQGFQDARGQAAVYAIYGASFTLVSVLGALVAGVTGAVVALSIGNTVLAGLYLLRTRWLVYRAGGAIGFRPPESIDIRGLLRSLLPIGAGALAGFAVFAIADIAIRTALIHDSGKAAAGLWFGLMSISIQFVALLVTAVTYFTAPLVARAAVREDPEAIRTIVDDSLRLTMLATVPVVGLVVALRHHVVEILFSGEFAPMAHYIPAQMTGDLLRAFAWPLGTALIPLGLTAAWVTIGISTTAFYGAVGVFLSLRWGLGGAVAAYVLLWSLTAAAVVTVVVLRRVWRPTRRSSTGLALSAIALSSAVVLPEILGVVSVLALSTALVAGVTAPSERASVRMAFAGLTLARRR